MKVCGSAGILMLGLGFAVACGASVYDAGTQNPFELGAGARALGLSGAYSAVADDTSALFWNPAGLARVDQMEVSAMHINLFFDTPYDFLGAVYPLLDWGTFAAGAARVATGGIITRDADSHQTGNGDGSVDLREYLFGFGRELLWGLSAGTVVKVDQERLLGDSASGVGVDLGLQFRGPKDGPGGLAWDHLILGCNAQNVFGSQLRLGEQADTLPLNLRLGAAYTAELRDRWQQKFLMALGAEKSTWRAWRWNLGAEYMILDLLALRGGLNPDGWSAGAGVTYAGLGFDYALAGQELGLTHRFSLTYRFGMRLSAQREARERLRQEAVDREAAARAEAQVKQVREELNRQLQKNETRYRREKQAILAKQEKAVTNAVTLERQKMADQKNQELELAYFKSLHYFNGIKAYMDKKYTEAVTEFETVAKFDPEYLELPFYLARSRQMAGGKLMVMSPDNLKLYYQGIDLYVDNQFAEAVAVWKKILAVEPGNLMVLRNIEETESRMSMMKKSGTEPQPAPKEDTPPAEAR